MVGSREWRPLSLAWLTMKKLLAFSVVLATSGWAWAAQPLLSPAELQAQRAAPQVRVIDIRDAKAYATKHIPGAVSAPYGAWRGPAGNPGDLPSLPQLTQLVQRLGLSPDSHAVVVSSGADASDFGGAARVYWTLKLLGLKELSILNGGMQAWSAAQQPQDSTVPKVAASHFAPKIDTRLIATRQEVIQDVKEGKATLVDARPASFFQGETRHPAAKLPGTLKGAIHIDHASWFAPGQTAFMSTPEAQKVAARTPLDAKADTVAFCNTGHWAATDWFALSEVLGHKNVKLYPGSMVDWTQDANNLPMDNVPGRGQQLLIDSKLWAERTFK